MKKNNDDIKKDNQKKNLSSQQKDSHTSKSSPSFDENSLSEIKKLANDFSMKAEENESENESLTSSVDDFENSTDFLDRLGDLSAESTKTSKNEEFPQEIENRLDSISSPPIIQDSSEKTIFRKKLEGIPRSDKDQNDTIDSFVDNESTEIFSDDQSNEDFLDQLKSSLENDPDYKSSFLQKTEISNDFKTYEQGSDNSEIIEDLEQEIVNADQATNPFLDHSESSETDDFISNLENLRNDKFTADQDETIDSPFIKQDLNLPSDSWEDLMDSTENKQNQHEVFDFDKEDSFEDFLNKIDDIDIEEEDIQPYSLPERVEIDPNLANNEPQLGLPETDVEFISSEFSEESEESVDSLRQSFINEFDQTAWEAELAKQNQKKWFPQLIENVKNWFKSLNPAEKILIILSFLISLAVLVAIFLVVTQWSFNQKISYPPPALEAAEADQIYPTGIELPGGWFFFLERGEIENNRWEPVNAEWLANTKLRRVVAIPWSNQSEAVIQSLTNSDEISVFMNNNDVVTYQVEEVLQISRENVRILSDTEPSLVVILFRDDDQDRWAVIATPK